MVLKLRNVEKEFEVSTPPTERSAKGAEKEYWVLSFSLSTPMSTDELGTYFGEANIGEMTFVTPLPNGTTYENAICGYNKKVYGVIKHAADGSCIVDLQFSKEAGETDEGSVANG